MSPPLSVVEIRDRIASAISVEPCSVTIDRLYTSPSGCNLRCWGEYQGTRYFAKVFTVDYYPVVLATVIPGEESPSAPYRRVEEQVDVELKRAAELRALAGPEYVPGTLGACKTARTIVWEQAPGVRLGDWIRKTWWKDPSGRLGGSALNQAGACLRKVHERSATGLASLDVSHLMQVVSAGEPEHPYLQRETPTFRAIQSSVKTRDATRTLEVPIAFGHGDFVLANLIWSQPDQRLSIVDFERCGYRNICHDLLAIVFSLRGHLINPLVPKRVIVRWEEEFWTGYGPIQADIRAFVTGLAQSRLFYDTLGRFIGRRRTRSWFAGITAGAYKTLFERLIVRRRFTLPTHSSAHLTPSHLQAARSRFI